MVLKCIFMPVLLQINSVANLGSTGRIAEQIGLTVQKNGWISFFAYGRSETKSSNQLLRIGGWSNVLLHGLISRGFDGHGLGSNIPTKRLISSIEQISPDIIHLHNIHGYYLNYKLLFEFLATVNIPIVWTLHDCWAMTGHCSHFDAIGCNRWKTGCYDCPLKRDYPKSLLMDCSKRNYKLKKSLFTSVKNMTIVPVSNWLGNIVKESYLGGYPCQIIHNGVDISLFTPKQTDLRARLGISRKKMVLLGVATSWKNEKGLQELIQLSANSKYQVVMVGVPKKIKQCLPKEIIAIERTNNQLELAEYYAMADVLVNATYNDSFPTINLESLACGTPVVTYRTGGSPEALNAETGLVVDKGDYNALVAAIEEIRMNGKSYYLSACRQRAETLYDKDNTFECYLQLYNYLLRQ